MEGVLTWVFVPLLVLGILELWGSDFFSEFSYRLGPVVLRQSWILPGSALPSEGFRTEHAQFWPAPSGQLLFRPRFGFARMQPLPFKGVARWVEGGGVEVTVRAPLFLPLAFAVVIFAAARSDTATPSTGSVVIPVVAVLFIAAVTYIYLTGALRELRDHLTSLTSASS